MGKRIKSSSSAPEAGKSKEDVTNKKLKITENYEIEEHSQSNLVEGSIPSRAKNQKKKNKVNTNKNVANANESSIKEKNGSEENKINHLDLSTPVDNIRPKTKGKSKMLVNQDNNESAPGTESTTIESKSLKLKKNKGKQQNQIIKFVNDEPIEVDHQINSHKKAIESNLSKEEEVKDEDIDKFCDEINEEDNLQYENWVKLIEAKLNNGNKKKPK